MSQQSIEIVFASRHCNVSTRMPALSTHPVPHPQPVQRGRWCARMKRRLQIPVHHRCAQEIALLHQNAQHFIVWLQPVRLFSVFRNYFNDLSFNSLIFFRRWEWESTGRWWWWHQEEQYFGLAPVRERRGQRGLRNFSHTETLKI